MADFGKETAPAIKKAADRYGSEPQSHVGNVKLLGADDQPGGDAATRAEARNRYQGIIDSSRLEDSHPIWQELRDTHERPLQASEAE